MTKYAVWFYFEVDAKDYSDAKEKAVEAAESRLSQDNISDIDCLEDEEDKND